MEIDYFTITLLILIILGLWGIVWVNTSKSFQQGKKSE